MKNKGKVVLIGAEDEENLAIRYLGAALKSENHEVKIISYSSRRDLKKVLNVIKRFYPDIVGISICFQSLALMFLELVKKLKKILPNTHITVGGHFPTFEYQELIMHDIDSVIRFEGEASICMLTDALVNGKNLENIPNLVYKSPHHDKIIENDIIRTFPDLDEIHFPLRKKKAQIRLGERFATLVASRGCFHSHCIYCCIGAFHNAKNGKKYAIRTPQNVALEMKELYSNKVRLFQFHDDNFLLPSVESNLTRLNELKLILKDYGIDLNKICILIKLRPDKLNGDIMDVLIDLGVIGIFLGVENASATGLNSLSRGSSVDDINKSLELIDQYGISTTFNLLMFHPKATLSEINENIKFMNENLDKSYDFGRVEIVAGSPLESLVKRKNLIHGKWPHWDYRIKDNAVEKMFRINQKTFYHEKSQYSELSHKMISLSYRSQLIKRLYPGKYSEKIIKKNKENLKKFNAFNLQNLLKIYELTGEDDWQDSINNINLNLQKNYLIFLEKSNEILNDMTKIQLLEKEFQKQSLNNYLQKSGLMKRLFKL
ncbi:B12-binding domain-containing radical SAM protein [Methanobacterium alcaliphilum]|uniref:B12-binding domain-containing radical SAM protein n=1 Tax=Methanobacterium alcaliphilum TaxID=392018 RepID=UPI00200B550E|nr:radical SAM protein [Methanobacterium alcaliphilum]MCK9150880.1 B12-binding domain-containing radical SAM protein [Methanobacterium alcaliphilum]